MRMHAPNACASGGVRHNAAHPARAKCVMRREVPDKQRSPLSVCRSSACQVFSQPSTSIWRKGKLLVTITLAVHADRASAPVDVVEPEPGDFAAPKAEAYKQSQDRQITDANDRAGIARREKARHLIGLKPLG